jgi:hypothetical protein
MNAWTARVQTLEWWSMAVEDMCVARVLEHRIEDAWLAECAPHLWRRNRGVA